MISNKEIELISIIASGEQGSVWKGKCRGYNVAVKIPFCQELAMEEFELLYEEVQLMSSLYHPNVCLFMGACLEPGNVKIVTELMSGSLDELINKKLTEPLSVRLGWALEVAKGILWLHKRDPPIIHMDIKPENVLYDDEFRIKVCDFGLCLYSATEISTTMGTPLYTAPEVLIANQYILASIDDKVDSYSFGMLLWQIVSQKKPFEEIGELEFSELCDMILNGERPIISDDWPNSISTLIEQCWDLYPEDRPDFQTITSTLKMIITNLKVSEQNEIIENTILSKEGQLYWKRYSFNSTEMTWQTFSKTFCEYISADISNTEIKCLEFLFINEESQMVTTVSFNKGIEWFGPFLPNEIPFKFINRITTSYKIPYFHGILNGPQAETLLQAKKPGTFLVRLSNRRLGGYAISVVNNKNCITHVICSYNSATGEFICKSGTFKTLSKYVKSISTCLSLSRGLACTKYLWVFNNTWDSCYQSDSNIYFLE